MFYSNHLSSRWYRGGLYGFLSFNKHDLSIRKNLGLYASQILDKKELPSLHKQILEEGGLERMAILEPSAVLKGPKKILEDNSKLILYIPLSCLFKYKK
jgi:hypothetical protein